MTLCRYVPDVYQICTRYGPDMTISTRYGTNIDQIFLRPEICLINLSMSFCFLLYIVCKDVCIKKLDLKCFRVLEVVPIFFSTYVVVEVDFSWQIILGFLNSVSCLYSASSPIVFTNQLICGQVTNQLCKADPYWFLLMY